MNRIAVDIVLLPDETMTTRTIDANANLVPRCGRQIALDAEMCLPHVSLAMGCIEAEAIERVTELLAVMGSENPVGELMVTGVVTSLNSRGESISVFAVAKTQAVQRLHEQIMGAMQPYFSHDVNEAMIYGDEPVTETTLAWIRSFREKAAFGAYFPHLTIGYGTVEQVMRFPRRFAASQLAVCHLGNHCTCRKVLASVML
jgi:hypothetical protein